MYALIFLTLFGSSFSPGSQDDCFSRYCGTTRYCTYKADQRECVEDAPTCRKSLACKFAGYCTDTEDGSGCLATSKEDCAASKRCKSDGLCDFEASTNPDIAGGRCVPKDPLACRRSTGCKAHGRCTFVESKCQLTGSADCRRSKSCSTRGQCDFFRALGEDMTEGCHKLQRAKANGEANGAEDDETCTSSIAYHVYQQRYFTGKACASAPVAKTCERFEPVVVTGVTASSTHPAAAGFDFGPASVMDGDPKTSWQPNKSYDGGVGEWLRFELEGPTEIARIRVRNGFQHRDKKFGELFKANNRVELLALWLYEAATAPAPDDEETRASDAVSWFVMALDFNKQTEQVIDLPRTTLSTIYLEIGAIEHGTRWDDLAISDIRFERCAD